MEQATQHLITGGDDPFLSRLLAAINRATKIDIAVAFIRSTGLILLQDAFFEALARGAQLRILTGDYLQITEPQALRQLMLIHEEGADVRIFECNDKQSFHMKAYIFTRFEGTEQEKGSAFVGSSNITRVALCHGLEWNLMVNRNENESRFAEISQKFDKLYNHKQAISISHQWIDLYQERIVHHPHLSLLEPGVVETLPPPEPNHAQLDALAALTLSRQEGFLRGLVVMATGLGKTWLAAFDTITAKAEHILFVAHREEILEQAANTFIRIRSGAKIGRYTGKEKELDADMLFASIQTIGKTKHLRKFDVKHFDYIIVDEFHHASARTYQKLLNYFQPSFLLGLTATPERTDQADILALCDNNLVFRQDLYDGIVSKLLCPFIYYGIADEHVNYQEISWRNSKFDPNELTNKLATQVRARHALKKWQEHKQNCTLAFCISRKHANFMADYFVKKGINAAAVHSSSTLQRNEALTLLDHGHLSIVFSVDLFNEGVDLPKIDTILMLRPTESKIVFLQQLGRGLRINHAKEKLVVIDFIGNHISFFRKPESLFQIGSSNQGRKQFIEDIKNSNLNLPPGCFVNYDPLAINFMERLTATRVDIQFDIYRSLKDTKGRRPTIMEFHQGGGGTQQIRYKFGHWFSFLEVENDLTPQEQKCVHKFDRFFLELEKTGMNKCFKMVLIEAFLELGGFSDAPEESMLAQRSYLVLQRHKTLHGDVPDNFHDIRTNDEKSQNAWLRYFQRNPINAWIGGNSQQKEPFFSVGTSQFKFNQEVSNNNELDTLWFRSW